MTKAKFIINMEDGTVGFRTDMSDQLPLTFHLIDDATAVAIEKGKVKASDVIEAIKKGFMSKPDFSWDEWDKKRRKEKDLRNVSQRDMRPVGAADDGKPAEPEKPEDVATLDSLGLGGAPAAAPTGEAAASKPSPKKSATKSAIDAALGN